MFKILNLALLSLLLSSCVQHEQDFVLDLINGTSKTSEISIFEGAKSVTTITDTTAVVGWENSSIVLNYVIYDITNPTPQVLGIATSSNATYQLINLQPDTSYKIIVRAVYSSEISLLLNDENNNYIEFTTNQYPNSPDSLSLVWPNYDNGIEDSPIIRVNGTKKNDAIDIFSDSSCTIPVASTIASPNAEYTHVQVYNLPLGQYNLYARLRNPFFEGECSEYSVSYNVSECPNNYVKIFPDISTGPASPFCVAKYEMKCADPSGLNCNGSMALSQAANLPWRNVTHEQARAACNGLGPNYHLITNPEWMSVARQIEYNSFNWTNFQIAQLDNQQPNYNPLSSLNRGHSNNYPSTYLAASTNDNDACFGITNTSITQCNALQWHINKRTHTTLSDDTIWDLAGNVWEWVDFSTNDKPSPDWNWHDINLVSASPSLPSPLYFSSNQDLRAQTNGVGVYMATDNSFTSYMRRGGNKDHGIGAGIYALVLREGSQEASHDIGFRCTYTITP